VFARGGVPVGAVEDFVINDEGVNEYLVVSSGGKLVTVPWDLARYDYETRSLHIPVTPEVYRAIPTYTAERLPNYHAPEYRSHVYKHFGLSPERARRLERIKP
jgi:hypothetical protein